ncbi:LysR substrate-binding domain-containing protein [Saccharopolyspora shandongensis]|uniref:LysR substrate-binding domain-containing protein n=1 Tax=Saccharopolyspora shandongensis TaxID=418495 RepID=UPI0034119250
MVDHIDLTQRVLEQFVTLAEERHFGRAAERLSMSQPPLSQAIQRLERRLGVSLIQRSTRSVELTPAGEAFAHDARHLLQAQDAAIERTRRIADGTEGELHLGFIGGLAYTFLPRVLRAAHDQLPRVRLHLHQHYSAGLAAMVRSGELDVAFVRGPLADPEGLTLHTITTEQVAVALPETHPLAQRPSLCLADLATENFALPSQATLTDLAEQVMAACRAAGFAPRDAARADSLPGLLSHVAAGNCVCLVPEQVCDGALPGVTFRTFEGTPQTPILSVLAAIRAGREDPAVNRLLELLSADRTDM